MSTPVRLGGFLAALAAVFAAALGLGVLVGPVGFASQPTGHEGMGADRTGAGGTGADGTGVDGTGVDGTGVDDGGHGDPGAGHTGGDAAAAHLPGGLLVSDRGYSLDLVDTSLPAGPAVPLRFRVLQADGQPLTTYQRAHEKDLHLVVVRRDLGGYQHVHPVLDADGVWSVPLDLSAPGAYRVLADFVPADPTADDGADDGLVLGADLLVPGDHQPVPLPAASTTVQVDGYTVTMDAHVHAGEESDLGFTVSRDGVPVTDLDPYLGAYGHLVALRAGDLAYLHVHPHGEPGDGITTPGSQVRFAATVPTAGTYRLYLDFSHGGTVRTAELTSEVTP